MDNHHNVKAGNTHKMRVQRVNDGKTGPAYVERPAGGREILSIYFRRETVKPPQRFQKIKNRFFRPPSVGFKEKTHNPYPERDKVQINGDTAGGKGNAFVQPVIHPGNRYAAGEQGRPVLEEKKIVENRRDAAQYGFAQLPVCDRPDAGETKRFPPIITGTIVVQENLVYIKAARISSAKIATGAVKHAPKK
jgi:hypothetical protein